MNQKVIDKFQHKAATVGIIGLGYVGLPLALRYCDEGFKVIGFDVDAYKIEQLNQGKSYISQFSDARIERVINKTFFPTSAYSRISEVDAIIICVPTPLNAYREPDLSYIFNTIDAIKPYLKAGQVIALESTTYPGTTDEEIKPRLEAAGFTVGEDLYLVFSPEREDPGNPNFETKTIPKICGGITPACLAVGVALYEAVIDKVVPMRSTRAAEMTKLLENIHRAVNIGLMNELKVVADKMSIDIEEVIQAAATKPFGFVPYYPGPGIGGHCIPVDPFYLTWKAREYGLHTRFIELAGEINSGMPDWVTSKVTHALNERAKPVKGSRILVLGISYKQNVGDIRQSPAVEIMDKLQALGADLAYHDPYFPIFPAMKKFQFDLQSITLDPAVVRDYDCVIITTAHDDLDYAMLAEHSQLLIDTRQVYADPAPNIVKA